MITWKILEMFSDGNKVIKVRYLASLESIESEGEHIFESEINKPFDQLKEQDLISLLIKETTKDEINPIKLNLENQLEALKNSKKVEFPWLENTFSVE